MNSFTNSILSLMLGWLRTLLNAARDFVSSDTSTVFFNFFRDNWRILFLVLCIGGFVLDKVVYLIRWRPRPIRLRRRRRKAPKETYSDDYGYDEYEEYGGEPEFPADEYQPAIDEPYAEAAPTMQYQMQPRENTQAYEPRSAELPYTTPYFAPEAAQNTNPAAEPPLHWDEASQGHTFAPAQDQQQRFAFGMAPSFGSAQSEPAYGYQRELTPSYAPPQFSQEYPPAETFAPQQAPGYVPQQPDIVQPPAYQEPSPYFRPFSDRGAQPYTPQRTRGLGAVAKRARNLLKSDEENAASYQDLQPTVDVSKAFHAPVYPEKKSEGDT